VNILAPMEGEWEALMDELEANLDPPPKAIYMPTQVTGGTKTDQDMLKIVWQSLNDVGIPILTPR
jgi:hypothetical protein